MLGPDLSIKRLEVRTVVHKILTRCPARVRGEQIFARRARGVATVFYEGWRCALYARRMGGLRREYAHTAPGESNELLY